MSRWARGATGLILGVIAGFLIVGMLRNLLLQHGETVLPGIVDAIIIFTVAALGFVAGTDPDRPDDE